VAAQIHRRDTVTIGLLYIDTYMYILTFKQIRNQLLFKSSYSAQ